MAFGERIPAGWVCGSLKGEGNGCFVIRAFVLVADRGHGDLLRGSFGGASRDSIAIVFPENRWKRVGELIDSSKIDE